MKVNCILNSDLALVWDMIFNELYASKSKSKLTLSVTHILSRVRLNVFRVVKLQWNVYQYV